MKTRVVRKRITKENYRLAATEAAAVNKYAYGDKNPPTSH